MRYNQMIELDQRYKDVLKALRSMGRYDSVDWLRTVYQNEDILKIESSIALMEQRTTTSRMSRIYPSLQ